MVNIFTAERNNVYIKLMNSSQFLRAVDFSLKVEFIVYNSEIVIYNTIPKYT